MISDTLLLKTKFLKMNSLDANKHQKGKGIKILTPTQIFQRLPIALVQVKAGNTSENVSLYREKEVTKKYITI